MSLKRERLHGEGLLPRDTKDLLCCCNLKPLQLEEDWGYNHSPHHKVFNNPIYHLVAWNMKVIRIKPINLVKVNILAIFIIFNIHSYITKNDIWYNLQNFIWLTDIWISRLGGIKNFSWYAGWVTIISMIMTNTQGVRQGASVTWKGPCHIRVKFRSGQLLYRHFITFRISCVQMLFEKFV